MANVRLDNITRRYQTVSALEEISFEVPNGEFWVLVGPSGCGKSTLLRMIAGLETVTSGNLYIDNQWINDVPARQRDVAMVFQNYALYPHLTVAENLAFGLKMRGADSSTIQQRVHQVSGSLSIDHLLNRKPKQLSGGQQQRVALGRAIAREPKVFLLDEPLSNLDAQLRDDTRAELKQLHQNIGITTIYVTHDQVEAMTLADQIVILNQGRIQQIGSPQTVYNKPVNQMVATFVGNPPMNILPITYGNSLFWLGQQSFACPASIRERLRPTEGQRFNLGIRPEQINLEGDNSQLNQDQTDVWALDRVSIQVEVEVVEPLGREILIRSCISTEKAITDSKALIQFMVPATTQFNRGDRVSVQLDFNQILLFDPDTGKTLYA
ncbi:MAG: ABC transporter ATP-binding protein [Microcoleaceae cyanobacterium]